MAKPRFIWPVQKGVSAECRFDVRTVKFGDGYEQRQPKSLKPALQKWHIECVGKKARIDSIRAFLWARRGVEAFEWTTPYGEALSVKAAEIRLTHEGGTVWKLSAEFEEVLG